jgi:hypothetical protein
VRVKIFKTWEEMQFMCSFERWWLENGEVVELVEIVIGILNRYLARRNKVHKCIRLDETIAL